MTVSTSSLTSSEPKPRVIQGYKLHLGEKTDAVLDALRLRGHRVEGETVSMLYAPGTDPYDTLEAADLDLEIRELATEHGVELDIDTLQIEPVSGARTAAPMAVTANPTC